MKNLLVGLLALALLSPVYLGITAPASAQDVPPGCTYALDAVTPTLTEPFIVIDEPDAVKALVELLVAANQFSAEDGALVTRVLLAKITSSDGVQRGFYGLEMLGCLLPPMPLPDGMDVPVTLRLSGAYPFGTFAAYSGQKALAVVPVLF
jgi:hypothetical protein